MTPQYSKRIKVLTARNNLPDLHISIRQDLKNRNQLFIEAPKCFALSEDIAIEIANALVDGIEELRQRA